MFSVSLLDQFAMCSYRLVAYFCALQLTKFIAILSCWCSARSTSHCCALCEL